MNDATISLVSIALLVASSTTGALVASHVVLVFDFEDGHCNRFARVLTSQRYAASVVCFLRGLDV